MTNHNVSEYGSTATLKRGNHPIDGDGDGVTGREPVAVQRSRVWDLRGPKTIVSEVYTIAMAKIIRVQVHGVEKAVEVKADKVELQEQPVGQSRLLKLSLDGTEVGQFKDSQVDGWWIED